MNDKIMAKNKFLTILFWGSLWGIFEATLGWGLHLIHFRGEALVLYPIGIYCMLNAMQRFKGNANIGMLVASVASLVKLANLFMLPSIPAYWVINPAIAILLEGGVFAVFCQIKLKKAFDLPCAFALTIISFLIFRGWQMMMSEITTGNPYIQREFDLLFIATWLLEATAQGVILVLLYRLRNYIVIQFKPIRFEQSFAIPAFIIALIATLWFN